MKEIRDHGSAKRYHHTRLGLNGRLDTIQCAILLSKMERYDWEVEQRNLIAKKYSEAFKGLEKVDTQFSTPFIKAGNTSVWAQYTVTVTNRDVFQKKMAEFQVPTTVHYPVTMPDQPWYKANTPLTHDISISRWAASHVVSLPMYPDMDEKNQDIVIDAVKKSVEFSVKQS